MNAEPRKKLVEVKHLKQYFKKGSQSLVKAVDDVSFFIYEGETFGLVGESGCGKSTIARNLLRIYEPTAGEVLVGGENIHALKGRRHLKEYYQKVQMIFQDPYSSLDPRMKISEIIGEGLRAKGVKPSAAQVEELLLTVGLDASYGSRYPHEFSGGQRQRIGIARALAVDPQFIVCDEPISALDVSIQAQIVNLLQSLQQERKLTYLFIAHDLSMVQYISDRIGVMYYGKLVEVGTAAEIYHHAKHPYTQSLLSAIPLPDPDYEAQRQRKIYVPATSEGERLLRQVNPEHFVYCTEEELQRYQSEK